MLINSSAGSRNRKTDSLSVCGRFGQKEACNMDKVKEECGVFGILDPEGGNVAHSIYYGLTALQHRGQEACGIVTSDTNGPVGKIWASGMCVTPPQAVPVRRTPSRW